ncbi:MAG: hypothetical protein KatS3mg035_1998 [Bacteroidia bacterium]|nr:MAG: hypothetical protein KatS3mg035_1998 [Bacteroidia bacterium]
MIQWIFILALIFSGFNRLSAQLDEFPEGEWNIQIGVEFKSNYGLGFKNFQNFYSPDSNIQYVLQPNSGFSFSYPSFQFNRASNITNNFQLNLGIGGLLRTYEINYKQILPHEIHLESGKFTVLEWNVIMGVQYQIFKNSRCGLWLAHDILMNRRSNFIEHEFVYYTYKKANFNFRHTAFLNFPSNLSIKPKIGIYLEHGVNNQLFLNSVLNSFPSSNNLWIPLRLGIITGFQF